MQPGHKRLELDLTNVIGDSGLLRRDNPVRKLWSTRYFDSVCAVAERGVVVICKSRPVTPFHVVSVPFSIVRSIQQSAVDVSSMRTGCARSISARSRRKVSQAAAATAIAASKAPVDRHHFRLADSFKD